MTVVLRISDMALGFGAGADFRLEVPALTLRRGDRIAIAGPSGCGKSTLLETLALLRAPDRAAVFAVDAGAGPVDVTMATRFAHLRQGPVGYVPQTGGVLPFLAARAHVAAALHLAGLTRNGAAAARLDRMAARLGLTDHLAKRRTALSGGQRKRVALLAGLAVPRVLLIADEPTAGLDDATAAQVMRTLADTARAEGTAVVIATHDLNGARAAGFAMATIADGRLSDTVPSPAAVGS